VADFQRLRKLAEFPISRFKTIPFSEHNAAPGAKHQVHQFAFIVCSKGEIRRHFASRTNEDCRSISSLHSRQVRFNQVSYLILLR